MRKGDNFIDCDYCARWHDPSYACVERERVYWKESRERLKRKLALAREGLEKIAHGNTVGEAMWHIAEITLSKLSEGEGGK